jgi:hypothetical protein
LAEDINRVNHREYEVVLKELFFGKDSALEKYAKVRKTHYELCLWKNYNLPLRDVDRASKLYFSRRFLNGMRIEKASKNLLEKGFTELGYACGINPDGNPVESGCKMRVNRLVNELNLALADLGFSTVDVERFIRYFTFDYDVVLDEEGKPKLEPGYGFQIWIFHSDENRMWFRKALDGLMHLKLRLPMGHVLAAARDLQKYSKRVPPTKKVAK